MHLFIEFKGNKVGYILIGNYSGLPQGLRLIMRVQVLAFPGLIMKSITGLTLLPTCTSLTYKERA